MPWARWASRAWMACDRGNLSSSISTRTIPTAPGTRSNACASSCSPTPWSKTTNSSSRPHEGCRRRLPRFQLRPRCRGGAWERLRCQACHGLAWRKRSAQLRSDRAAGRLFLWRLSALGRNGGPLAHHARRGQEGPSGRRRAGDLQRIPGSDWDGPAAGRADAQRVSEIRLPGCPSPGSSATIRYSAPAMDKATWSRFRSPITTANFKMNPWQSSTSKNSRHGSFQISQLCFFLLWQNVDEICLASQVHVRFSALHLWNCREIRHGVGPGFMIHVHWMHVQELNSPLEWALETNEKCGWCENFCGDAFQYHFWAVPVNCMCDLQ